MSKKFLVTGGCGFIGSEAVRQLTALGHSVINIDKLTYASSEESLSNIPDKNYTFIEGDIANKDIVKKLINNTQPNYILNFAAESHVDRSIECPEDFINTNILGTFNLINESYSYFSALSKIEKTDFKFIHISTDEVYGSLKLSERAFVESDPYKPNSPYSASKASSDLLVRSWFKTFGLPAIITHSSNNYGPWQFPEKLIPLTVSNILKGNPIEIYGKGQNVRDWIYVQDHIEAIISIVLEGEIGEIYNIGGNCEVSNIEMVRNICNILNDLEPKSGLNYNNLITFVEDRPGHDMRYALDITKINKDLSWSPKTSLDKGLKISIEWMLDNKDWLFNKSKDHKRIGLKKN